MINKENIIILSIILSVFLIGFFEIMSNNQKEMKILQIIEKNPQILYDKNITKILKDL